MLVRVILPLPLNDAYTYSVPLSLEGDVDVGSRVVVPLGSQKLYSGIVMQILQREEVPSYALKDIIEVLDSRPIVTPAQISLWQWMASYYVCTLGEVSRTALPSMLKLQSETRISRVADFQGYTNLTEREQAILSALGDGRGVSVAKLQKSLGPSGLLPAVRSLMSKGALSLDERIESRFKPRKEVRVRLASRYLSAASYEQLLADLARTPKRLAIVESYAEIAGLGAALNLSNPEMLRPVSRSQLLSASGVTSAPLAALAAKGVFEFYDYEVGRLSSDERSVSDHLRLTDSQQAAYDQVLDAFKVRRVCLLHGVTSSGKTEIYIRLIKKVLSQNLQVLYLLPEIALTTQITFRLRRVFGNDLGVYHSALPAAERVEIWNKQLSAEPYGVMLGPRSALFLPFRRLGLVIVDEEHETSYKQQDTPPLYNARDTAVVLAQQAGAHVLLGTATPSLETYTNALTGKYSLVSLTARYSGIELPKIEVVDVRELTRTKQMRQLFSPRLLEEMDAALKSKQQVILFRNRRGYAPVIECAACGWVPRCDKCDVALTYHYTNHMLECHYCGRSFPVPAVCPACGSHELRNIGFGTEKVEEAVKQYFPTARTARLDLDTTRSRGSYDRILSAFSQGKTDVLIGTQMVSKGLDFDGVHVVGVLNADTMMSQPDFRAAERTFQMLTQVAGRAGRRGAQGIVLLQTKRADYPIVAQVVANDYKAMYDSEMAERREFNYPPFCRLIYLWLRHRDEMQVDGASHRLAARLGTPAGVEVLGPERPFVSRVNLKYIRKIVLKVPRTASAASVRSWITDAVASIKSEAGMSSLSITFDIDPI